MVQENTQPNYISKVRSFTANQLTGELWRFARGVVQLSSALAYGPIGSAIAAVSFGGLSTIRYFSAEYEAKKRLLDLYAQEISEITGTPTNKLDFNDLEKAAQFSPNGKKNAIALELEALHQNNSIALKTSLVGIVGIALLATLAASIIPATLLTGPGYFMASTAFGMATNFVFMSVDHVVSSRSGGKPSYNFNSQLKDMVSQSRFNELKPEQVFNLLLKGHPEIEDEISKKYAKPYLDLAATYKSEIVEQYENKIHAKEITQKINRAEMNVQKLGFIAYDESLYKSRPSEKNTAEAPKTIPEQTAYHAARIETQRLDDPGLQRLH